MNKKTKRKYWIAAIIWFVTMVLANSINEYFHASPLNHRGLLGRGGLHPVQGPDAAKNRAEEG